MNHIMKIGLVVFALLTLSTAQAFAADLYVDPSGSDSGDCSNLASPCKTITYALTQAAGGDTLHLAAGTYKEANLDPNGDIIIQGNNQTDTIIDADTDSNGTGDGQILLVDGGSTVTVSNITFKNGVSPADGGAIDCETLSTLNVDSCTFDNNESTGYGGAIYSNCNTQITDSTFTNNKSTKGGGAIEGDGGTLKISGCTIAGNSALEEGGGVNSYLSTLTIEDTTIDDNESEEVGGGLSVTEDAVIRRSTISNNKAGFEGGGIYFGSAIVANVINSTISGNESIESGGGIYLGVAELSLHNLTITDNIADIDDDGGSDEGGGIYLIDNLNSKLEIENSIVAGNMVGTVAGDCYKGNHSYITSGGYNILGEPSSTCDPHFITSDQLNVDVATVIDPLLLNNGGPTLTHALIENSPAIDAGTPVADGGCQDHNGVALTVDQRSFTRPVNDRCDIGAVERGTCGDGAIDFDEECDDGTDNSDTVADACRTDCTEPICGDGVVDSGEECDDGNIADGDGCDSSCKSEGDAGSGGSCHMATGKGNYTAAIVIILSVFGLIALRRRKSSFSV